MGQTDRAALGRFVMRTKEYRAIVRVRDGALSLTTMLMHDEVRATKGIAAGQGQGAKKQLDTALGLIEAMTVEWDPASYEDEYRARLLARRRPEAQGQDDRPCPTRSTEPSPVPDLMAALERTISEMRDGAGAKSAGAKGRKKKAAAAKG